MSSKRENSPQHVGTLREPWSVPISIAQVPVTGLHRVIEASTEERRRLAETAGIDSISELRAEFTLHAGRNETFRLEGRVTGTVGQTCVVSLEPLNSQVDEPVELIFAPPEQIAHLSAPVDDDDISERADPPEPIRAGIIDLGRVATDAFFLGINPYPRKPDAVLDLPPETLDPDDHPFAALKALKADGKPPER